MVAVVLAIDTYSAYSAYLAFHYVTIVNVSCMLRLFYRVFALDEKAAWPCLSLKLKSALFQTQIQVEYFLHYYQRKRRMLSCLKISVIFTDVLHFSDDLCFCVI